MKKLPSPKEKALELIESFYSKKDKVGLHFCVNWSNAIACALIAVDEIIKIAPSDKSIIGTNFLTIREYYESVKKELEKDESWFSI
jgi:hypothetical protein